MKRPRIADNETAIYVYYNYPEIGNKEIKLIFGRISTSTILKLKKAVKEKMIENNTKTNELFTVDTELAFEVWGIDVKDLLERRQKLKKLDLCPQFKKAISSVSTEAE